MDKTKRTEQQFLAEYDAGAYERPSVTADMLIFTVTNGENPNYRKLPEKKFQLLLIKRGGHPYLGQWALPGGFVNVDESLDDAAARELKTETGIDNIYMEQLYTWGNVGRDPRTRVISCSYMALVDGASLNLKPGDDADEAKWFTLSYHIDAENNAALDNGFWRERRFGLVLSHKAIHLSAAVNVVETLEGSISRIERKIVDAGGIAFDHAQMIQYAVERLRNKLEYTDIVFNLMPRLFTLTELQQVYEIILGQKLLAAAFRRKIAPMVLETEHYTGDAGHRPSKLYRFNPEWREQLTKF